MDNLLVILRKPPYGLINSAEAVRHAGAASGFDYKSTLYLVDGGVLAAKKGQESGETGFTGIGESFELLSDETGFTKSMLKSKIGTTLNASQMTALRMLNS